MTTTQPNEIQTSLSGLVPESVRTLDDLARTVNNLRLQLDTIYAAIGHNHSGTYEPANSNIQTHIAASAPHSGHSLTSHTHTGTYEPANANIQNHISNTSNPHSTTAAQVGALGYALHVSAANQATLTDAQTIYWGNTQTAPTTSAAINRVYIPKAGTIKAAIIFAYAVTAGSNENWSVYIRLNNTTDYLIETEASAGNARVFSNTAINTTGIAVSAGDFLEIKEVHPTWGTNPANVTRGGSIYIEA